MELDGGFGQAPPSYSPQTVATFPGPEDFLDPGENSMNRLVPGIKPSPSLGFVAAPHAGGDDPCYAALSPDRVTKVIAAVGAVGEHFTGIVGQSIRACPAVIDVGRCDRYLLDQRGIGICSDMRLEAMNGAFALVLYPARIRTAKPSRARSAASPRR